MQDSAEPDVFPVILFFLLYIQPVQEKETKFITANFCRNLHCLYEQNAVHITYQCRVFFLISLILKTRKFNAKLICCHCCICFLDEQKLLWLFRMSMINLVHFLSYRFTEYIVTTVLLSWEQKFSFIKPEPSAQQMVCRSINNNTMILTFTRWFMAPAHWQPTNYHKIATTFPKTVFDWSYSK